MGGWVSAIETAALPDQVKQGPLSRRALLPQTLTVQSPYELTGNIERQVALLRALAGDAFERLDGRLRGLGLLELLELANLLHRQLVEG